MSDELRDQIGKFIRLLASPIDGEVVAAARALERKLKSDGSDMNEFSKLVELAFNKTSPKKPVIEGGIPAEMARQMARTCLAGNRYISQREFEFLAQCAAATWDLSDRQTEWLRKVYARPNGRRVMPEG